MQHRFTFLFLYDFWCHDWFSYETRIYSHHTAATSGTNRWHHLVFVRKHLPHGQQANKQASRAKLSRCAVNSGVFSKHRGQANHTTPSSVDSAASRIKICVFHKFFQGQGNLGNRSSIESSLSHPKSHPQEQTEDATIRLMLPKHAMFEFPFRSHSLWRERRFLQYIYI